MLICLKGVEMRTELANAGVSLRKAYVENEMGRHRIDLRRRDEPGRGWAKETAEYAWFAGEEETPVGGQNSMAQAIADAELFWGSEFRI